LLVLALVPGVMGCASGEPPPAAVPTPPPAAPSGQPSAAEPKAPVAAGSAQAGETPAAPSPDASARDSEPASAEEAFQPERPPREIITAEDTTFSFNFAASEIGMKTDARCEKESAGNRTAHNTCVRQVRDQLGTKVLRFVKKDDEWLYLVYSRTGNQFNLLQERVFEFGEETANTVTIKFVGTPQGGTRGGPLPRELVITIPNSYSIQLDDPEHGKMSYSTKIGMTPPTD
jgi:hypothetical protein